MRRPLNLVLSAAVLAMGVLGAGAVAADDAAPVKIGYAIARSGPWAPGAQSTQEPNYLLWAEQVNAAGGLNVNGVKRKVELIGYDDRSDTETVVRTYEKLMTVDKVDLILPPWGTNANFAVAPLANRYKYPIVAPTALSRDLVNRKLPYFFCILQQADRMVGAAVDMMAKNGIKTAGAIYMDELFGMETKAAFEAETKKAGIQVLDMKAVPLGTNDLSGVLQSMKAKNPDAFVAFTYPPESILASKQSKEIAFNPKVFFGAVGIAFPLYRDVMGPAAEGVAGMGLWNKSVNAAGAAYYEAHTKKFGKEPEHWGSAVTYASLQVLQKAVEAVGLDREKIQKYVASNKFDTLIGPVEFKGSENVATPGSVGQWQQGQFQIVWPQDRATAKFLMPKPAWQ
ncbi:MAG: amino acid ABC transporter substrate-binding protein [Rhodospirillales bacterium]|nr:amino acid ABC transporter substrate-binding protein [Rhodospirillales bacterium]